MNEKEFWPSKSGFTHDIHVSWLHYGDIRIRDTFVYKHILGNDRQQQQIYRFLFHDKWQLTSP